MPSKNPPRNSIDITPPPSAFVESLRSMGYSIETALADIVDNSITAGATNIEIRAIFDGDRSQIAIADNGCGMNAAELRNALLFGGNSVFAVRSDADLGRFGFGLKTASISQGRRLTVYTKAANSDPRAVILDLDQIGESNSWEVEVPRASEVALGHFIDQHGTLILWEKLDRLLPTDIGTSGEKAFNEAIARSMSHLELVFHRFLAGEPGTPHVSIVVNGQTLEALDPFFRKKSISTDPEMIPYGGDYIRLQSHTLPHHTKVTKADWDRHAGPSGYMGGQGFYVYRAKRLIQYGTWFAIIAPSELTKLARVQLDVPTSLDQEWQVDVRKSSIFPPRAVRQKLKMIIEPLIRPSKRAITRRGVPLPAQAELPVWRRMVREGTIVYAVDGEHPAILSLLQELPPNTGAKLKALVQLISMSLPLSQMIGDIADRPDEVSVTSSDGMQMRETVLHYVNALVDIGMTEESVQRVVFSNELFLANRSLVDKILREVFAEASSYARD